MMRGGIPEDTVSAADGEVVGLRGLAEDGAAAIGGEQVEIFIHIVKVGVLAGVDVDRFGSPDLGRDLDDKGRGRGLGEPHGCRGGTHGAYQKSGEGEEVVEAW